MLKHLYIKNYALIEELDIDFESGFSVITGETGAGKSILLGAVGLLLGQRADTKSIQAGANKCIVEAEFKLDGFGLEDFFEENELDFEQQTCIIRRELTSAGKSRAFINDTPATVAQLKTLGAHIIDIHSQHQNLLLANENFQMDVLDSLGHNTDIIKEYTAIYREYRQLTDALAEMRQRVATNKENKDYIQFQLNQLTDFNPLPGEDETLQEETETLSHAEDIKSVLFRATSLMNDEPQGIILSLRQAQQLAQNVSRHYPNAEEWTARLESAYIELKDIAAEMEDKAESIAYDPQRLEILNARLDELYTLEKKHHVDNADELIELKENFQKQLDEIDCGDEGIDAMEKKLGKIKKELTEKAKVLTATRKESAKYLQTQMKEMLTPLGMPNAQLEVRITPLDVPAEKGMDQVTFYFSANKSGELRPIADVASGGEIARVMLTLKALISEVKQLPTIIFDEIDTGVSGHIAECMAKMMQRMAATDRMQVISITHLPQIAAIGTHHYWVHKEDYGEQTLSHITRLSNEERIREIANMLSGAQVTQAAIENAKQLLRL